MRHGYNLANTFYWLISWVFQVKLPLDEYWRILSICPCWFRWWRCALNQQTITWISVDKVLWRKWYNKLKTRKLPWYCSFIIEYIDKILAILFMFCRKTFHMNEEIWRENDMLLIVWFYHNSFKMNAIIWTNDGLVYWCTYASLCLNELTHWGRDKMDAISQKTFSSAFSWLKMFEFQLKFHWSLFLGAQLAIFQHWFR